jgi:predicted small lipoprotein YifL
VFRRANDKESKVMTAAVRKRWHGGMVATVAAVVAVTLAGCGKSGGPAATPASSKASAEKAQLEFTRCMRDHGANVKDAQPNTGGGGGTSFSIQGSGAGPLDDAMKACQKLLPKAGGPPPDPAEQQKAFDRALKFSQCMRQHGVNMPDPQQKDGGMTIMQSGPEGAVVDPQSKQFQDAQKACEQFFGPPGGKGGPGSSTHIEGGGKGDGPGGGMVFNNG